jgi:hypothetical protein
MTRLTRTPAARAARARARRLYQRARLNRLVGRRAQAAQLCRRALECCDYTRAYKLLAALELPGEHYLRVLAHVHAWLHPATYVEVGVARGASLRLLQPDTWAIGIDPAPRIAPALLGSRRRVVAATSDEFFARHDLGAELGGRRLNMAFIDGMHHFEFALRDLMNLEPYCTPDSVIFVHDCYPIDARTAAREQVTDFWSGDVWRLIVLLKRHRPDLAVYTLGVPPTGLGLITRLDPGSTVIREHLGQIVSEGLATEYGSIAACKSEALNLFAYDRRGLHSLLGASRRA